MRRAYWTGWLRRRLFREEFRPTVWGRFVITLYGVRGGYPRCSKKSWITQKLFRKVVHRICSFRSFCGRELERSSLAATPKELQRKLLAFLNERRFRSYVGGPLGWSCDETEQSILAIDRPAFRHLHFVGLRVDVAGVPHRPWSVFAIRHELQHEIQRCRARFTCQQLKQYPCMVGEMELEANLEALYMIRLEKLDRIWDPYSWEFFIRAQARYMGASPKQKTWCHYAVGLMLFGLACFIPAGTEGIFCVIFLTVAATLLTIIWFR